MIKISRNVSLRLWTLLHFTVAIAIVLIPSQIRTGKPVWSLSHEMVGFLTGVALTYLLSILVLTLLVQKRKVIKLVELVFIIFAVFGGYSLLLLITESFYSRTLFAAALALSVIFIILSFSLKRSALYAVVVMILVATLWMQALGPKPNEFLTRALGLGPKPTASVKVINTQLYSLSSLSFSHYFDVCSEDGSCRKPGTGGGLSRFDSGYLLATGEGMLHFLTLDQNKDTLQTESLPYRIPINSDEYESSVGENIKNTFRVTDILVHEMGERFQLLAAHHFWNAEQSCGVLRVSRTEGEYTKVLRGEADLKWQTVYDTEPCLPAEGGQLTRGSESGGRMVFIDDGKLLLTVGDHEYDGINRKPIMAQDVSTSYGKTILINLRTGVSEVYSIGHRNPQGLYVDPRGTIWSTEHGPSGGDELNILLHGSNYGWPLVTHGTQYGMHIWPNSTNQGQHDGFQRPMFAWLPSIAVSNLVGVQRELFPLWRNDLLVASFKKTLYRVRIREGQVQYVESISIPGRIRDLLEDDDGKIVLYLDLGTVMFIRPISEEYGIAFGKKVVSEEMRGQVLFANCSGCHKIEDGSSHGIGPDLSGIVGHRIAGATGYTYSNALASVLGTWSERKLDEFLASPQLFAPGTTMAFQGIPNPSDRAALIRYMKAPK